MVMEELEAWGQTTEHEGNSNNWNKKVVDDTL